MHSAFEQCRPTDIWESRLHATSRSTDKCICRLFQWKFSRNWVSITIIECYLIMVSQPVQPVYSQSTVAIASLIGSLPETVSFTSRAPFNCLQRHFQIAKTAQTTENMFIYSHQLWKDDAYITLS